MMNDEEKLEARKRGRAEKDRRCEGKKVRR